MREWRYGRRHTAGQRDEHLPRPWIGQAESDFDRLLALLLFPQPGADALPCGPAAAFSPAVAAPANSASILRSLSRRAASSSILVPFAQFGEEESRWRMQSFAAQTTGGMMSSSKTQNHG
jgi:hypothetical protein